MEDLRRGFEIYNRIRQRLERCPIILFLPSLVRLRKIYNYKISAGRLKRIVLYYFRVLQVRFSWDQHYSIFLSCTVWKARDYIQNPYSLLSWMNGKVVFESLRSVKKWNKLRERYNLQRAQCELYEMCRSLILKICTSWPPF